MKTAEKMANKKIRKAVEGLKQWITKNYGKRCAEYNQFCAACIMWHAFDTIKEGAAP